MMLTEQETLVLAPLASLRMEVFDIAKLTKQAEKDTEESELDWSIVGVQAVVESLIKKGRVTVEQPGYRFKSIANRLLTDEKLRELALDLYRGEIFCDRHIIDQDLRMTDMIFIPLGMMDKKTWAEFIIQEVGLVYEYIKNASPRGINGYPIFMTIRYLNEIDAERMWEIYQEIETALSGVGQPKDKCPKEE